MKRVWITVAMVLSVAACNDDSGTEYLGKWESVNHNRFPWLIERNGNAFIARLLDTNSGGAQSIPAMLKDGTLMLQTPIGNLPLAIDKKSGHLLISGDEFQKSS